MQLSQELTVQIWLVYLFLINLIAIAMMWWDKRKAERNDWRVPEVTLLIPSFIGGAIGVLIGMYGFRHKTRKRLFQAAAVLGLLVSLFVYWLAWQAIYWWLYL